MALWVKAVLLAAFGAQKQINIDSNQGLFFNSIQWRDGLKVIFSVV